MNSKAIKNAVIFKELTLTMKHIKLVLGITILNALLSLASLFVIGLFSISAAYYSDIPYVIIVWIFIGLLAGEAALAAFIVPALTAGTISGERERQTLDVLLTTKMSTMQIIWGKYVSAMLSVLLVLISSIPFMSLVFIYGGLSILQMIGVICIIILSAMYLASFGIWFSTLTKKTLPATILSYLWVIVLIGATLWIPIAIASGVSAINSAIYYSSNYTYSNVLPTAPFLLLMYVNPAVTLFDAIGHIVGYTFDETTYTGMNSIVEGLSMTGYNPLKLLFRFWTPLSLALQMLITFLMLRWSAYLLNPTRGNKARMKQFEKMMAKKQSAAQAQQSAAQAEQSVAQAQQSAAQVQQNAASEQTAAPSQSAAPGQNQ